MHVALEFRQPDLEPEEIAVLARGDKYVIRPGDAEAISGLSDEELQQAAHLMAVSRSSWEDRYVPTIRTFEQYCKDVLGVPVFVR